jgi:hypothetical protein
MHIKESGAICRRTGHSRIAALTLTHDRQLTGTRGTSLPIGLLTAIFGVGQVLGPLVAAHLADGSDAVSGWFSPPPLRHSP